METGNVSLKNLFINPPKGIEELPINPKVFWYVSAGDDFRSNIFFSDRNLQLEEEQNNRIFSKPDVYIYNSIGIVSIIQLGQQLNQQLHFRRRIKIYNYKETNVFLLKFEPLELADNNIEYEINNDFFDVDTCNAGNNIGIKKAYNLEIRVEFQDGENEIQKVIYFEQENSNLFYDLILKNKLNITHFCTLREGLGMGCARRSMIDLIYRENFNHYFINQGFKPELLIIENDYTHQLFLDNIQNQEVLVAQNFGIYFIDPNCRYPNDPLFQSPIYKLSYNINN